MNRFLLIGVAALAVAGSPALAADMAVKAPVYGPGFSWTGCYFGVNGGGAFNNESYTLGNNNAAYFGPAFAAGAVPGSASLDKSGGIVGGTFGCNYQTGNIVFGGEADADYANLKSTQSTATNVAGFFPAFATASQNLQSLASIRGRLGYTFDHLLLYGTAGIALGNTNDSYSLISPAGGLTYLNSVTTNRTGFTGGVGAEYALGYGFSAKVEGLYYELHGSPFQVSGSDAAAPPGAALIVTPNHDSGWAVKAGFNYKVW